jgi:MFS family permease
MNGSDAKLVWLVSLSHFITHGFMTLLPAVLVAIATEQSISFLHLGVIVNIGYFLYGLGALPAGYMADRVGSKKLLAIGVLGLSFSSILVSISPSVAFFTVAYGLLGVFASIHHPAGLSLIARRIGTAKGKAMGLHGVMGNLGLFLSPMVAAFSVMLFGTWRAAYLLYGILGLMFFFLLNLSRVTGEENLTLEDLNFRRRQPAAGDSPSAITPAGTTKVFQPSLMVIPAALLLLYLGSILSGFIFRGSLTFLPALFQEDVSFIANHDQPGVMAGYLATAVLSLGLIGAWFGGYINDKIKRPELVPVFIFLVAAPALYYTSRLSDAKLIAVVALFSLVYYGWQPSQNYLIAKYTSKASHGLGYGISFFLIFGMGSLATSVGGYIADDYGVDRIYWLMAGIAGAALLAAAAVLVSGSYLLNFNWKPARNKVAISEKG